MKWKRRLLAGRWTVIFSMSALLLLAGCAASGPAGSQASSSPAAPAAGGYETPGVLKAQDFLPPEVMKGEYHQVMDKVASNGYTNTYAITSTFGDFQAYGDDMVRIRVREINAIAAIREIKGSEKFAQGAVEAAKSPLVSAWNLLVHPVDTVTGIPKGLQRYLDRAGEAGQGKGGRSRQEDDFLKEVIGFSVVKRRLAAELGVDVYSSNKTLQKELNALAWTAYSGGVGIKAAMAAIPGPLMVGISIQAATLSDQMNKVLSEKAPLDLRLINRAKLEEMGVADDLINQFLQHEWYTPRSQTIITTALAEMGGTKNREAFIRLALTAASARKAFGFQRTAEMMRGYHLSISPIREVAVADAVVLGFNADGVLLSFFTWDYAMWTPHVEKAARTVVEQRSYTGSGTKAELWVSGRLSPKAKGGIEALGAQVRPRAFERYGT